MELFYLHYTWNMHYPQFMNTEQTRQGSDSYSSRVEEMSPAAYVAEDGVVGHQREERPFALERLDAPV